ncbi:hypothetical protein BC834DRAFT_403917 [Gloeopeniophorella convolvens]|nr:hypothetical protein BC834DRAFT_403917 [Gloeopeniophorella convolvens]
MLGLDIIGLQRMDYLSPLSLGGLDLFGPPSDALDTVERVGHRGQYERPGSPVGSDYSDSSSDSEDEIPVDGLGPEFERMSLDGRASPSDWDDPVSFGAMEPNALGLGCVPFYETHPVESQAFATPSSQAESLRAPQDHQNDRSRNRSDQKHRSQRHVIALPSEDAASGTLVLECLQDITLRGGVDAARGPMNLLEPHASENAQPVTTEEDGRQRAQRRLKDARKRDLSPGFHGVWVPMPDGEGKVLPALKNEPWIIYPDGSFPRDTPLLEQLHIVAAVMVQA